MVSAVGAQLAQEMGHLSLLELMAACGHFSPAAFKQSWERGVRGERWGEGRGGEGKKGEGSERGEGREGREEMWEEDGSRFQAWDVLGKCTGLAGRGREAGPWAPGAGPPLYTQLHTPESTMQGFPLRDTPRPLSPTPMITDVISTNTHQDTGTDPHQWTQMNRSRAHSRTHAHTQH